MGSLPRVIVIGTGPAGCAAGLDLARNGILPLLVEKGLRGKDKACGDAWIPSAVEELRSFDTDGKLGSNQHSFDRINGFCSERKVWSFDLTPFEGVIARRANVDQGLRDRVSAVGCQVWYGAEATDLRVTSSRRPRLFWRPEAAVGSPAGRGSTGNLGSAPLSRPTSRPTATSPLPHSCSASLSRAIRGSFPWARMRRTPASSPSPKPPRRTSGPR